MKEVNCVNQLLAVLPSLGRLDIFVGWHGTAASPTAS